MTRNPIGPLLKRRARLRASVLAAACCLVAGFANTGQTLGAPAYGMQNIGLIGPDYTHSSGLRYSIAYHLNEAGQVAGESAIYSANGGYSAWLFNGVTTIDIGLVAPAPLRSSAQVWDLNQAGQVIGRTQYSYMGGGYAGASAWLYSGSSTVELGLIGAEFTRSDGSRESFASAVNESGQVLGTTTRYNGGTNSLGQSLWVYDGSSTVTIGLSGPDHTRNDGLRSINSYGLTETGLVAGTSQRFFGASVSRGQSAWLYNGTTTQEIGLIGPDHTRNDAYKFSRVTQHNEAGQVAGTSTRYFGASVSRGESAWRFDGTTSSEIGLIGAEHTRSDAYKDNSVLELNQAGQVTGYAQRFNGGGLNLGRSAWLFDGSTTVNVGLTGTAHTRNDGFQESQISGFNEAGQVAGSSTRFYGASVSRGQSAWHYDGEITSEIGLIGPEHTRNDAYKLNQALQMNEAGQVIGYAERFNGGGANLGYSAWLYDGSATLDIGLQGSTYTSAGGISYHFASGLTEGGQAFGTSSRWDDNVYMGETAWIYDAEAGTLPLVLSTRVDGYAYSEIFSLSETGLGLGFYELYDGMTLVSGRLFGWTAADGAWDLGVAIRPDDYWYDPYGFRIKLQSNALGYILAPDSFSTSGYSVYLLTPVPEPGTISLALVAAVGMVVVTVRRHKR